MAFSSTAIQPVNTPVPEKPYSNDLLTPLLGMLMLSVYAAHKSKKAMRKMKRRFLWTAFKLKVKSMFSKAGVSDRTLIYILIGVIALILIFYAWQIALVLALVALVLVLAGVI